MTDKDLIKTTCLKYNLTYAELAIVVGASESSIRTSASKNGKLSNQTRTAINLYLENMSLKEELKDYQVFKDLINKICKTY